MRTYRGSCRCKQITFEADLDLAAGTTKCNCTSCFKRRWWAVAAKPDKFRALTGESELVELRPAGGPGGFCKHCGIVPFAFVDPAEWNDGAYYSINVACLDDLSPEILATIPIQYLDGLHDAWWQAPAETRYL